MGKPAARLGDMVQNDAPHCHAPIHPPAPVPTPVPLPALPQNLIKGAGTVLIGNQPAARVTDTTSPCIIAGCVPGGPAMVALGAFTVLIENLPAARVGDMTAHTSCVAPIPGPTGKILPPGCPTVLIGG
ncbi:MAG TPA: PAAR domain-containing protein [Thermoanaerobaculia bacterium]|nr:PAAR domain-containing protein [Thermoanaerobaculia bacterium]